MTALFYLAGVLVFAVGLMLSIALHELGHLHYAKRYGCRVSQYMIGFGPTLWTRIIGETEYGVKAVPLGGYVKIIGMFPPVEPEPGVESNAGLELAEGEHTGELTLPRSSTGMFRQLIDGARRAEQDLVKPSDAGKLFYQLPPGRKIVVMLAGPMVNLCLAFVCFLSIYAFYGVHSSQPTGAPVVSHVSACVIPGSAARSTCAAGDEASPAAIAGLRAGDRITSVNGRPVRTWDQFSSMIQDNGTDSLDLVVERDGRTVRLQPTHTVTIAGSAGSQARGQTGFLGVSPVSRNVVTHHGPIYTLQQMNIMIVHSVKSIAQLPNKVWNVAMAIVGNQPRAADGPMSIVGGGRLAGDVASSNAAGFDAAAKIALLVLVLGSFNLFIGVFNLIPLLPLDGGQIAGAIWEVIRTRGAKVLKRKDPGPVNVAAQLPVTYVLALVMISMTLVLMVGDLVVPVPSGL